MEKLVKTMSLCTGLGFSVLLLDEFVSSFYDIELAPNYFGRDWFRWAKTQASLRDLASVFLKINTDKLVESEALKNSLTEIGLIGVKGGVLTLLAAHLNENFMISFPIRDPWNASVIKVWILNLELAPEETDGEIFNIFDDSSFEFHKQKIKKLRNTRVKTGKEIWEKRKDFWPELHLLEDVRKALISDGYARAEIQLFRHALDAMNQLVRSCDGKRLDFNDISLVPFDFSTKISNESDSVFNHPQLKKQRMFWLEDGREVYCEKHIKFGKKLRLHFFPCEKTHTIYVAYFGPHLPTKRDK